MLTLPTHAAAAPNTVAPWMLPHCRLAHITQLAAERVLNGFNEICQLQLYINLNKAAAARAIKRPTHVVMVKHLSNLQHGCRSKTYGFSEGLLVILPPSVGMTLCPIFDRRQHVKRALAISPSYDKLARKDFLSRCKTHCLQQARDRDRNTDETLWA